MNPLINEEYPCVTAANDVLLAAAEESKLHIDIFPLLDESGRRLLGSVDEELYTIVIAIGDIGAKHTIWLTNGVHGLERPAGTLYFAWLARNAHRIAKLLGPDIRIILIDNINPWGWSYLSRFLADGTDLNRNFRDDFEEIIRLAEGRILDVDAIDPSMITLMGEIRRLKHLAAFWARYGSQGIRKVVAIGQCDRPGGILYTGNSPSQNNRIVRDIIRKYRTEDPGGWNLLNDHHTGLGSGRPSASIVCAVGHNPSSPEYRLATELLGFEPTATNQPNNLTSAYEGNIERAFEKELLHDQAKILICKEVGTVRRWRSGLATMLRHCALRMRRDDDHWERHGPWTERLARDSFYLPNKRWRESITERLWDSLALSIEGLKSGALSSHIQHP